MGPILDFLTHVDASVGRLAQEHSAWIYPFAFLVALTQTGFVLGPVLPGSTILFLLGAISRSEGGKVDSLTLALIAILGGSLGCLAHYGLGFWAGPRVFSKEKGPLSHANRMKTEEFFEKHGRMAMYVAPSVPVIRTFSSIIAGAAEMPFGQFSYSAVAGVGLWVATVVGAGCLTGIFPASKALVLGAAAVVSLAMIGRLAWTTWRDRNQGH